MTETNSTDIPCGSFAHAVATARSLLGYSIEGAAGALGIPESMLCDVENGHIELTEELRTLFEAAYGIALDTLVPIARVHQPRTPIAYDPTQGILRVGTLGVRFRHGSDDNDVLLRGFSSAIRRLRRLPPSVPLQLRSVDMPILANLLDLTDPELDQRAQFWFGQTPQTAQSFGTALRLSRSPEAA